MKKGTVIFNSKPFAYILSNSHRSQLCDSCFKGSENLLKCSNCAFAYYCNKKCQKAAWKLHKKECPNLKKVFPNIPTDSVRLLAQIIFLTKAGGSSVTENVGDMTRSFNDLISHAEKIQNDKNRLKQFCALVTTLKVYIGEENIPSGTELLEMFGKMVINSVTITTGDLRAVGAGLYLGLSKLDHSCKPNAVVNFDGIDASVRLIEDLSVADFNNVFISYIDQINLKEERQKQLLEQYYFTCHCCACCDPTIEDKMTEFLSNDDCTDVVRRLEENQAELTTNILFPNNL
ncbi:Bzd (predicted) [Pycnogonum litorale]